MAMMRLQKILAEAGLGSRRACEAYIEDGRVTVDGVTITRLGAQADPDLQEIAVDKTPLRTQRKAYYLLNKPVGYLCTNRGDATKRPLAVDLIRRPDVRLFCVGRLDVDSKGAILVTNDGTLSNLVTHPRYNVSKTYRVRVRGPVDDEALETLKEGVWLSEGRTGGIDIKVLRTTRKDTVLRLIIEEGKNRIIRRAMAKVGLNVIELERTRIGHVAIGKLPAGSYRELTRTEIQKLLALKKGGTAAGRTVREKPKPSRLKGRAGRISRTGKAAGSAAAGNRKVSKKAGKKASGMKNPARKGAGHPSENTMKSGKKMTPGKRKSAPTRKKTLMKKGDTKKTPVSRKTGKTSRRKKR